LCAKSEERLAPATGCCESARTAAGARKARKLDGFIVERVIDVYYEK
jgi:L-cysteine desulfidase